MIKGITSTSKYLITGGSPGLPYISPGAVGAGMLRFNANTQNIEVNDGHSWQMMAGGFSTVNMSTEAESLLDWIKSKQRQEIELLELASQNQAVLTALENVKKAQEQLTIIAHLSRETNETTS